MTVKEMSNCYLMRYIICKEREIKTYQSALKEAKDELNKRFDEGTLVEGKEEENV